MQPELGSETGSSPAALQRMALLAELLLLSQIAVLGSWMQVRQWALTCGVCAAAMFQVNRRFEGGETITVAGWRHKFWPVCNNASCLMSPRTMPL